MVNLRRAGSIKGRLVDEDGLPLTGAGLSTQTTYPEDKGRQMSRPSLWPDSENVTSDNDGRFQVDGLKPGLKSSLQVRSKGRPVRRLDTDDRLRDIVVQPDEVRDVGDVIVKAKSE